MPKVVLAYTVFREVQLDQVDKTEIEQLQSDDQATLISAGFEVEDPTWELDDEGELLKSEPVPSVHASDDPQERPSSDA
jgi:hypothetical protein